MTGVLALRARAPVAAGLLARSALLPPEGATFSFGGNQLAQGTILFAPGYDSGLRRIPAEGGQATDVTTLDRARHENSHRFPQFFPDGRHFIFLVRVSGEGAANEVMVASLEGGSPRPLVKTPANATFVSGRLLYVRDRALVARRFDPDSLLFEGPEIVVGDDVHVLPAASLAVFSASRAGTLVYDRGSGSPLMAFRWFDRSGREIGSVGEPGPYYEFALSPDGRRAALSAEDPKTGRLDVFILDVRAVPSVRRAFASLRVRPRARTGRLLRRPG